MLGQLPELTKMITFKGKKKHDATYKIQHLDTDSLQLQITSKQLSQLIPWSVIEVGSIPQHLLKLLQGIILLFNATVTPIAIAYGLLRESPLGWVSTGLDIVYLFLIGCKFRMSFHNQEGDLCYQTGQMVRHYVCSWVFLVDVASVVPLEHFVEFDMSIARLGNLLHGYDFGQISSVSRFVSMLSTRMQNFKSKFKKLFSFVIYFHILICIWLYLNHLQSTNPLSWRNRYAPTESPTKLYFQAAYFILVTATSVGYGDMVPATPEEYIVTIVIMHLGVIAYSLICGTIINVIRDANNKMMKRRRRKNFLRNLTSTLQMEATKKVLDDMFKRIDQAKLNQQKQFLKKLPITMRTELSYFLHQDLLQSIEYFRQQTDRAFIGELCLYLRPQVIEAGEYLFGQQQKPEMMYFHKHGDIQLVFDDQTCTEKLDWEVYGEIDVVLFDKRYYQFRAMTTVQVMRLAKVDYQRIFTYLFPKKGEQLTKLAILKNKMICRGNGGNGGNGNNSQLMEEKGGRNAMPQMRLIQISKDLQKVENSFNALIDSFKANL